MTIHAELNAIRERVEQATEGPWRVDERYGSVLAADPMGYVEAIVYDPIAEDNAEFIAHARTDLPRLLMVVEKVLEVHKVRPCDQHCTHEDICGECWEDYPCPTVTAITTALEGK